MRGEEDEVITHNALGLLYQCYDLGLIQLVRSAGSGHIRKMNPHDVTVNECCSVFCLNEQIQQIIKTF